MASIQVDDQTAKSLSARAAAEGVSVSQLLARFLALNALPGETKLPSLSTAELDKILDEEATEAPLLPADFSRDDLYAEHD